MAEQAAEVAEFDRDIAVRRTGEETYAADLAPGWVVGRGVNGGYLLSVAGNALRHHFPDKPDPVAISAHYLSASVPGPAEVTVGVRHDGGSLATATVELSQGGVLRLTALATYGDLGRLHAKADGRERVTAIEPDLPPREQCAPAALAPEKYKRHVPMLDRFDLLMHPQQSGWALGEPSGTGTIAGWYRLQDGRDPDPLSLLQVLDALPPVTYDLGMPGWAPTIQLTCHLRARPAPGWLRVHHTSRNMAGGMFEEDCEVWDSAGRLVAQSRQLARTPR